MKKTGGLPRWYIRLVKFLQERTALPTYLPLETNTWIPEYIFSVQWEHARHSVGKTGFASVRRRLKQNENHRNFYCFPSIVNVDYESCLFLRCEVSYLVLKIPNPRLRWVWKTCKKSERQTKGNQRFTVFRRIFFRPLSFFREVKSSYKNLELQVGTEIFEGANVK